MQIRKGQLIKLFKAFYPDVTIFSAKTRWRSCQKMLKIGLTARSEGDQVRINVNQQLPLGGPPGHVTIQTYFFFNKDLEYLRYGSKGSCLALSISKMKVLKIMTLVLELLVHKQSGLLIVCTMILDYSSNCPPKSDHQEHNDLLRKKDFKKCIPMTLKDLEIAPLRGWLLQDTVPSMITTNIESLSTSSRCSPCKQPMNWKDHGFIELYKFSDDTLDTVIRKHWITRVN
ncbi:hypothetical protein Tco_1213585 [Tanacetum coccineum]